jgi:hypothetical protein
VAWLVRIVCVASCVILIGGQGGRPSLPSVVGPSNTKLKEGVDNATVDPRVEAIARVICIAKGIDPDYEGLPYPPGPVWRMFIQEARIYIAAYDADQKFLREQKRQLHEEGDDEK